MSELFLQFSEICKQQLLNAGYSSKKLEESKNIVLAYYTLADYYKRTKPCKRHIHIGNLISISETIRKLLDKVEGGESLLPYMSKTIFRDLNYYDSMLYDFNIYHFHLGNDLETGGKFIKRTNELLFAWITDTDFYVVGIYQHGDWCDDTILNKVKQVWPSLLKPYIAMGAIDVKFDTMSARSLMRSNNINSITKLDDGTIISPPGGSVTMTGASVAIQMVINDWNSLFQQIEERFSNTKDISLVNKDSKIYLSNITTSEELYYLGEIPPIYLTI